MIDAVMPVLVAGIHAGPLHVRSQAVPSGVAWMAGTSLAMTHSGRPA